MPRFGPKLAPQHTTLDNLRAVWRIADDTGFDHTWTYDHFASVGADVTGDTYEGWLLLATLAEVTQRVRIGCMVSGNTYRHPAILAKMASTVDHLSGGRLEFGLGAAWAEFEHDSLGIELGTPRERLDRFDEACQVIRSLWTQDRTTFEGAHYRLSDAVHNPKPVQRPHPPIWLGGKGRKRTLRTTAKYADAWNMVAETPELFADLSGVLDQHCADIGRDPHEVRRTVQIFLADDDFVHIEDLVEAYVRAGADDIILVVQGPRAVEHAQALGDALPRLRAIM